MAVPLSESATVLRKRFAQKKCIRKCYQGQTGTFLFLFCFCFLLFLTGFDPSFAILGNVIGRSCNFETSCFLLPFRSFFFKVTSAISDSNLLLLGGDPVSLIFSVDFVDVIFSKSLALFSFLFLPSKESLHNVASSSALMSFLTNSATKNPLV